MSVSQPGYTTLTIRKKTVAISYLSWDDEDTCGNPIVRCEVDDFDCDGNITPDEVLESLHNYLNKQ